ncbi:MAG: hypothetical protein R3F19_11170 [Verrucomicrobiales bacterium]
MNFLSLFRSSVWLIGSLAVFEMQQPCLAQTGPLNDALDLPGYNISQTGWVRQTKVTHDGQDALQATSQIGARVDLQIPEPAIVRFWWKLGAMAPDSFPFFSSSGEGLRSFLREETDWREDEVLVDTRVNAGQGGTVTWSYQSIRQPPSDQVWLDQVTVLPPIALATALDTGLVLQTGAAGAWRGWDARTLSHDGVDFVSSGVPAPNESAWLETEVVGPGTASFQWRFSSEGFAWLDLNGDRAATFSTSNSEWHHFSRSLSPGMNRLRWSVQGSKALHLDALKWSQEPNPIAEALDTTNLNWTTSGILKWETQSVTTHDGIDALQIGFLPGGRDELNPAASVSTVVEGPGHVRFWMKQDRAPQGQADHPHGATSFFVDATEVRREEETIDWELVEIDVPPGTRTLTWEYARGVSASPTDAAWLDELVFVPMPTVALADALDGGGDLVWSTGGGAPWAGYASSDSIEGGSLATSLPTDRTSWVEAKVNGPGGLDFWWRFQGSDTAPQPQELSMLVDGYRSLVLGGIDSGWRHVSMQITPGEHVLRWRSIHGMGFLDAVHFRPEGASVIAEGLDASGLGLTTERADDWLLTDLPGGGDALQTIELATRETTFSVEVVGPGTLSFQWRGSRPDLRVLTSEGLQEFRGTGEWQTIEIPVSNGLQKVTWDHVPANSMLDALTYKPAHSTAAAVALDTESAREFGGMSSSMEVQSVTTHDGVDALRATRDTATSGTVLGLGALSFWVKAAAATTARLIFTKTPQGPVWETVTGTDQWQRAIVPLPPGLSQIEWWVAQDFSNPAAPTVFFIDEVERLPFVPLAEALDTTIALVSGGDETWVGMPAAGVGNGADYAYAVVSPIPGPPLENAPKTNAWIEATVSGGVELRFRWNLTSGSLRLLVDGEDVTAATLQGWREVAVPLSPGIHQVRWELSSDQFSPGIGGIDAISLGLSDLSLETAMNLPAGATAVSSGGAPGWTPQTEVSHDGIAAAQFGPSSESGTVTTTIDLAAPATISFWVKSNSGSFWFSIGNESVWYTPGAVDWTLLESRLNGGRQRLSWLASAGAHAWIDEVKITPSVPLSDALDTEFTFRTGGDGQWRGFSTALAEDRIDAAFPPDLLVGRNAWIETTVTGPGDLSFLWRSIPPLDYYRG